jgi:hypothetical protein
MVTDSSGFITASWSSYMMLTSRKKLTVFLSGGIGKFSKYRPAIQLTVIWNTDKFFQVIRPRIDPLQKIVH